MLVVMQITLMTVEVATKNSMFSTNTDYRNDYCNTCLYKDISLFINK